MYNNYMPNNFGMNNNPNPMNMMNMGQLSTYQQPQQQQVQPQQNNGNPFITVSNMQEAKEKVLAFNSSIWMRDASEPYIYFKEVDFVGTSHFKVLKVEDVTDQMLNNNGQNQSNNQFVQIQDFNVLNQKVEQLQNSVNYYSDILNKVMNPTQQVVEEPKKVGGNDRLDENELKNQNKPNVSIWDNDGNGTVSVEEQRQAVETAISENKEIQEAIKLGFKVPSFDFKEIV